MSRSAAPSAAPGAFDLCKEYANFKRKQANDEWQFICQQQDLVVRFFEEYCGLNPVCERMRVDARVVIARQLQQYTADEIEYFLRVMSGYVQHWHTVSQAKLKQKWHASNDIAAKKKESADKAKAEFEALDGRSPRPY